MKKILFIVLANATTALFSQDVSFGLKFTPQEQLQGIPLASTPFSGVELPAEIDLSKNMPPAGNQGKQQSCVAWAVGYAYKSYQEKIEEGYKFWDGATVNKNAVFSPAFIYNQINNGVDGGSHFSDALNVLSSQGAVKLADMPYNEMDFTTRPTDQQKNNAKKYKIDFWRRVNFFDSKEMKAQLNAGYPVLIGAAIDKGFVSGGWNANGSDFIWSFSNGEKLGGHAMVVVGYSDSKGAFKVINSWGRSWGNDGFCWISYSLFSNVVREAYVMKDAVNSPDNNPRPNPVPSPTSDLRTTFQLTNFQHNIQDYRVGSCMKFIGTADIPQGLGRQVQVVVKFYLNNGSNGKGLPVGSLSSYFMMPDGTAACGTPKSNIVYGNQPWFAMMPYSYLNVPRGYYYWGQYQPRTTYLVAEPILFIDDFAVQTGQLIPFFVML